MHERILVIPIDKIKPLFTPVITKEYLKRMEKAKETLHVYDLLLAVEKHPDEDSYILVGGFDKYYFMNHISKSPNAICLIETSDSYEEMLIKTLRRLMPRGDNSKENRLQLMNSLKLLGFDNKALTYITGFSKGYLDQNYSYDPRVPPKFINGNSTHKTLNAIASLNINEQAKEFLYDSAALPKGNPQRLTGQVTSYIMSFIRVDGRLEMLTPSQQVLTLDQAFNPKRTVIRKLMNKVSRFIPYKKTS
ncbi:hypothetical protein AAC978_07695 [Desulfitobacterium sp. THU1]|uniref:hypothetical protein n=1 Tax=Desulfitobacterium sp. THU1 TaxID=3138072 RepID=UPI00311E1507